jgi:deoxyribodipyrimidine photo-lyase
MKTAIYWFRNDLRTTDNPSLMRAISENDALIPLFVFDQRWWNTDRWGHQKTGAFRTKFLLESVADLRDAIESLEGRLYTAKGNTAEVMRTLVNEHGVHAIYAQKEHTSEECSLESEVAAVAPLILTEGLTLIHPDDLPMPIEQLPDVFTRFRNKVEKFSEVRPVVAEPETLTVAPFESTPMPHLVDFGFRTIEPDPRAVTRFKGGSLAAWDRLDHYFWKTQGLSTYKTTRNGLIGADYSSKFSPWLANGALSPREVYAEVKRYEAEHGANESTYWLVFELLWRDYFRFVAMRYGDRIFYKTGIKSEAPAKRLNEKVFARWADGRTGDAFVDANMRELTATGFMSNRGRQNVASYLVHDMGMDWRMGASFFEHHLIDHDPTSNYGNWIYVAGVGNDPRESRKFNTQRQAEMYDPEGAYVRLWLT